MLINVMIVVMIEKPKYEMESVKHGKAWNENADKQQTYTKQ